MHFLCTSLQLIEWLPPDVELMDRVKLDVLWVNACEELFAVL